MNRFFYLLLLSAAFAACSDDDGPKTPPVEYDVISFEPAEGMLDAVTGQEVKLGEVKMSLMGSVLGATLALPFSVETTGGKLR